MYPIPPGPLPITGIDMLGIGIAATALIALGVMLVRIAYFARYK